MATKDDDPSQDLGSLEDLVACLRDNTVDPDACETALWQEGAANRLWEATQALLDKAVDANPEPSPMVLLRALAGGMAMTLFEVVDAQAIKNSAAGRLAVHMGVLGQFLRMYIAVADSAVANPSHGTATRH